MSTATITVTYTEREHEYCYDAVTTYDQQSYHVTRTSEEAAIGAIILELFKTTGSALPVISIYKATCEGCDGSGIRDHASPDCGCGERNHIIERCDTCERYDSDRDATIARYGTEDTYHVHTCPQKVVHYATWE